MKVTLVNPPWSISEQYGLTLPEVGSIEEPLGLAYIAAVLERAGHQCRIIDGIAERMDQEDFEKAISADKSDLIGITALTPMIKRTSDAIKTINELKSGVPVVMGGAHIGAMQNVKRHEELFRDDIKIDFAVYGEGEYTLLEIVERLEKGQPTSDIDGTIVKQNGKVVVNKPRELIELDDLPFPARHLLPKDKNLYRPSPSRCRRFPVRSIVSSRGCPFKCIYCDKSVFGPTVRYRSPKKVADEIEHLINEFGARELRFWDDNFTLNKKLVLELCNEIIDRKLDILWTCFARVNTVDREMLEAMKKAGCWQVDYGIESGDDQVLKNIRKGFTAKKALEVLRLTRDVGFNIKANFLFGLPGDTVEKIEKTIEFAKECDPDVVVFHLPQAYPGTELFEIAIKENALDSDDWTKYLIQGDEPSYINPAIGKEKLQELRKKAYKEFYLRPKIIIRYLRDIRSLSDVSRYVRGALAVRKM